jgi:hypothetical protein
VCSPLSLRAHPASESLPKLREPGAPPAPGSSQSSTTNKFLKNREARAQGRRTITAHPHTDVREDGRGLKPKAPERRTIEEKAVDKSKIAIDSASYKLYYVN